MRWIVAGVAVLVLVEGGMAQTTMYGGRGMLRVRSARTVGAGNLYLCAHTLHYVEKVNETLAKDHTLRIALTVGLSNLLELNANVTPYQDTQHGIWGPPGDSEVGLKFRYPYTPEWLQFGLHAFASFPTGAEHPVPYEPYSSGKLAWGLLGIWTLDMREYSRMVPFQLNLQLGYMDQDVNDRYFRDRKDQGLMGAGLKFPVAGSVLYLEYTAEVFVNHPDVPFAKNSMRLTPGFKFVGPWNLIYDVALDVLLTDERSPGGRPPFVRDYADWKLVLGVTYPYSLLRYLKRERQLEQRRSLEGMEEIRRKRLEAAKELEELRKRLEQERKPRPE
ncbi:MAG: hypothetical protein ONB23_08160 [candidate division KSB1 bacterium]|nr:hypothetical protein [candidate division KSB1 bacterium]